MVSYLRFYARKDVQKKILEASKDREVAFKFGDKGFGKRPDILQFEGDVFEMAKQGVTSFHISEERWNDPLQLSTGMSKKQLDELRKGWDLILDIDGPFEVSKITTQLILEALKFYDIDKLTLKFSGNKGFHLAVPFEAFPANIQNQKVKDLFPDGPRTVAAFLSNLIKDQLRTSIEQKYSFKELLEMTGKQEDDLLDKLCGNCNARAVETLTLSYECKVCKSIIDAHSEQPLECPQCKSKRLVHKKKAFKCTKCQNDKLFVDDKKLNPFSVVDIDTVLISSRHMFRAPYSINEKSGLVSVPINPDKLGDFNRSDAEPEKVKIDSKFLSPDEIPNASRLIVEAFDWFSKQNIRKGESIVANKNMGSKKDFDIPSVAIKADYFPPCILKIMEGIKEDGRKRSLFILFNFLKSCGWSMDDVQDFLCNKWNKNNYEPLREGYVLSQISWHKKQSNSILPPNCDNKSYYNDLRLCSKDGLCGMVRNPVNYAIRKSKLFNRVKKPSKR